MSTAPVDLSPGFIPQEISPSQPSQSFLMCPPHLYDVDYVINPWMAGNIHAASRERAEAQWHQLYDAVSKVARVSLVDPQPGSPDMVFTANAGLLYRGQVAISSFFHPERQGEEPHFRQWFVQHGYNVIDMPRETPFEGEGDALFTEDGSLLWAGFGPRSARSSHDALRRAWGIEIVGLELVDSRFYHLDTCFAPLEGGYILYYPHAFSASSRKLIEAYYSAEKRIAADEADAAGFCCNAINVGSTIILNQAGSRLTSRLSSMGFDVVHIELSEFLRAGGAAKCLVMKLD